MDGRLDFGLPAETEAEFDAVTTGVIRGRLFAY